MALTYNLTSTFLEILTTDSGGVTFEQLKSAIPTAFTSGMNTISLLGNRTFIISGSSKVIVAAGKTFEMTCASPNPTLKLKNNAILQLQAGSVLKSVYNPNYIVAVYIDNSYENNATVIGTNAVLNVIFYTNENAAGALNLTNCTVNGGYITSLIYGYVDINMVNCTINNMDWNCINRMAMFTGCTINNNGINWQSESIEYTNCILDSCRFYNLKIMKQQDAIEDINDPRKPVIFRNCTISDIELDGNMNPNFGIKNFIAFIECIFDSEDEMNFFGNSEDLFYSGTGNVYLFYNNTELNITEAAPGDYRVNKIHGYKCAKIELSIIFPDGYDFGKTIGTIMYPNGESRIVFRLSDDGTTFPSEIFCPIIHYCMQNDELVAEEILTENDEITFTIMAEGYKTRTHVMSIEADQAYLVELEMEGIKPLYVPVKEVECEVYANVINC